VPQNQPASDPMHSFFTLATDAAGSFFFNNWITLAIVVITSCLTFPRARRALRRRNARSMRRWKNCHFVLNMSALAYVLITFERMSTAESVIPSMMLLVGLTGTALGSFMLAKSGPKPYSPKDGEEQVIAIVNERERKARMADATAGYRVPPESKSKQ
jgi:hypothetical protein